MRLLKVHVVELSALNFNVKSWLPALSPVASQVLAEFNARLGPVHTLFVGEGDDMNLLCRPQHGQRIGNRSRRRPAVIPGNGDPVERRRQLARRALRQ